MSDGEKKSTIVNLVLMCLLIKVAGFAQGKQPASIHWQHCFKEELYDFKNKNKESFISLHFQCKVHK